MVGTLPIYGDKVLLCKRAIKPRYGKWTLPAGFMENGESSLEGAVRETMEEAGANIDISDEDLRAEAIEWSMTRGGRSGRVAWQYIQDLAGRRGVTLRAE